MSFMNGIVMANRSQLSHYLDTVDILCSLGYGVEVSGKATNQTSITLTCDANGMWSTKFADIICGREY